MELDKGLSIEESRYDVNGNAEGLKGLIGRFRRLFNGSVEDPARQNYAHLRGEELNGDIPEDEILRNAEITLRGRILLIGKLEDKPVGYALGRIENEQKFFSEGIYISPEHRKKGYGGAIKSHQENLIRNENCQRSSTLVLADNTPAILILKKSGYEVSWVSPDGKQLEFTKEIQ